MPERQLSGRFARLACGLALALMLALPTWVAAAPTPVAVGASTVFAGNGFSPSEALSFWETGPDGTVVPLGGAQTDSNGGFTFTVSFPSAGSWTVTAHSINSGHEVTGTYAVGSTTTAPTTTTTTNIGSTTTSGATPYGTAAGVGSPVSFTGNGFAANESISLWETGPDSSVIPLTGTDSDSKGTFGISVTFPTAGNWQITAHGKTTSKETIGRYAVGTGTAAAPSTAPGTPTATTGGIAVNATTTFSGTGFNASEGISLWETAPDATVVALPGINADSTGAFTTTVSFPTSGNWQVTAHGHDSAHETIGPFTVGGDSATVPTTTSPVAGSTGTGTPVKTTTSTLVTFSPSGFTPGETVSV